MEENKNIYRDFIQAHVDDKIKILAGKLYYKTKLYITIDLLNISEQDVRDVCLEITLVDDEGKIIKIADPLELNIQDITFNHHSIYQSDPIVIEYPYGNAAHYIIRVSQIHYANGDTEILDGALQKEYPVEEISEELHNSLKALYGHEAFTYAINYGDEWKCICGNINHEKDEICNNCQRNRDIVLSNLTRFKVLERLNKVNENISISNTVDLSELSQKVEELTEKEMIQAQNAVSENDGMEKETEKTKGRGKKFILAACLLLALVLGGYFGNEYFMNQKEVKADGYVSEKKYSEAIDLYNELLEKKETEMLLDKKANAVILKNSQDAYNKGIELADAGDQEGAIRSLIEVTTNDKNYYEEAQAKITEIETVILDGARTKLAENDFGAARIIVERLLKIIPASEEGTKLSDAIDVAEKEYIAAAEQAAEEARIAEEKRQQELEQAKAAAAEAKKAANMQSTASNLMNTLQFVVIDGSNVRSGPGTSNEIIAKLPYGSYVSVYNTSIEGTTRVWCYGQMINSKTGASTYGWISNENLNSSL